MEVQVTFCTKCNTAGFSGQQCLEKCRFSKKGHKFKQLQPQQPLRQGKQWSSSFSFCSSFTFFVWVLFLPLSYVSFCLSYYLLFSPLFQWIGVDIQITLCTNCNIHGFLGKTCVEMCLSKSGHNFEQLLSQQPLPQGKQRLCLQCLFSPSVAVLVSPSHSFFSLCPCVSL